MKQLLKKTWLAGLLALVLALAMTACGGTQTPPVQQPAEQQTSQPAEQKTDQTAEQAASPEEQQAPEELPQDAEEATLPEDGVYTSKEDVALYIHTYGRLPENFVTKKEAEAAGWSGGSVAKYLPGKCIGGSSFGNKEGLLPDKEGRRWTECDINTVGKSSRGAERIVFSNDGLIFYTDDHYESFEQLY